MTTKRPKRRTGLWLIGAALLLGLAAVLMSFGEKPEEKKPEREVTMPKRLRPEEKQRMEARRTMAATVIATDADAGPSTRSRARDPLLAALARTKGSAVVIEANALRYSPIGELLINCLARNPNGNPLQKLKDRANVDLLKDLDRVAITDEGLVMSGHFGQATWDKAFPPELNMQQSNYGTDGTLFNFKREVPARADGTPAKTIDESFASWNKQVFFVGDTAADAQAVIDRIEGRGPDVPPLISEEQTYGEIYGVLAADDIAKLLPPEQAALAAQLKAAATRIELHVDASHDVGIVAQVKGDDAAAVTDLGKTLGAALSLSRLRAQAEGGDPDVAQLLEQAMVRPDGDEFRLEMALPLPMLEKALAKCGEDNRAESQRGDAGP